MRKSVTKSVFTFLSTSFYFFKTKLISFRLFNQNIQRLDKTTFKNSQVDKIGSEYHRPIDRKVNIEGC